jgi:very-long-chain enoyl-CoA reductase
MRTENPSGLQERVIPQGLFFDQILCPNYTFEILSWLSYSLLTGSIVSFLLFMVGVCIMHKWAREKQQKLLKMEGLT